ncbi:basement membrane-specific heparan sulfate proteoglycan core protein-like [Esox lucius]|uniref:basement membrane-specific heparan sulfate proteoglycan core protein-like n=1 Tax=Esox lucius TaxID=8010 RepID=UPI001476FEFC|nr:basement membrane-specific heparan sulfate proteoglycan core protein-like [Esox lucius]
MSNYTDWTYRWYREDQLQSPGSPSKTITTLSDQVSQYQCQGRRTDRPQSSQRSDYLHISVTANQTKATLSSDQQDILTGDSVTLTCTVESSGWRFYWYKHKQDSEPVKTTSGSSYTLSQVSVSDGGQYRCRAGRGDPVYYTQYSEPVHIQVTAPPTASVSVSPHGLLYSGESVTLQCDISNYTGWTYWWYRKDQLQSPGSPSKTISTLSDQVSQYQCQGRRTDRPQSSQRSVFLKISVTANQPKATLSSDQKDILTGDSVTLTCTVESSGWRFYWYRHRQDSEPVASTSGSSYTLSQVSVSDGGQYRCRAGRGDPVYYTQYSEPVHIQVTAPPTASVSVSPHGLLYSGESVTLQCDISDYTDWTYRWYRNKQLQSPGSPSKTISTLSDQVSQYQCQGRRTDRPQSSQRSVFLKISVTANQPKATLSSDQKDILTGDSVTLTCTVESSGWRFYWYRHRQDSEPVASTSGSSYTLSQVNVSDGGQYRCRAGRGDPVYYTQYSEPVHIQVTAPPTASVSVSPHGLLYSGESVTLQCDISNYTGWTYWWYRKDQLQSPGSPSKTISTLSDQVSQYQCQGRRTDRPQSSQRSVFLKISVTANQPKATLSSDQKDILTGDSVTLTCTVESSGWRFYWYRHRQDSEPVASTSGSSYTLSQVSVSDGGQYRCRAGRGDPVYYTQYSEPVHIQVTAPPTASVSVSPHGLLYSGESVTLQCDISDYTDWTYRWYRNKQLQSPGSPSKTISTLSDQVSQYQCQGRRTDRPQSSQRSVFLKISVTANQPKATLSSDQKDILTGDSVTLTCTVESSGWRFYWYRHRQDSEPVATTSGSSYTLSQVNVSDGGQYRCRAGRGDPVYYTQYSEPVHIQVTAPPTASVSVSPHGLLYSGESVTLQCDISDYTDWTYRWYRNKQLQSPGSPSKTISTLSDQVSQYQCQGRRTDRPQSSQRSVFLKISVTANQPKATLSSDQKHILTGDNVTLTCTVESSGWRFYWYRHKQDSEPVATTSGSSYTLSQVNVSDGRQYRCRAGRGDPVYYTQYSEPVHIQVTVPVSSTSVLVGVVVGLVVAAVLLTIFLVLLCRGSCGNRIFRPIHPQSTNQDPQQDQGSTQIQAPDAGYTGNLNIYHLIHHPDNNDNDSAGVSAADGSGDVKYDKIQLKKLDKKRREKPADPNKNTVYSEMKTVKTAESTTLPESESVYSPVKTFPVHSP